MRKLETRHCAFVTFADRGEAEKAAEGLSGRLFIQVPPAPTPSPMCRACGHPHLERRSAAAQGRAPAALLDSGSARGEAVLAMPRRRHPPPVFSALHGCMC